MLVNEKISNPPKNNIKYCFFLLLFFCTIGDDFSVTSTVHTLPSRMVGFPLPPGETPPLYPLPPGDTDGNTELDPCLVTLGEHALVGLCLPPPDVTERRSTIFSL